MQNVVIDIGFFNKSKSLCPHVQFQSPMTFYIRVKFLMPYLLFLTHLSLEGREIFDVMVTFLTTTQRFEYDAASWVLSRLNWTSGQGNFIPVFNLGILKKRNQPDFTFRQPSGKSVAPLELYTRV